MKTSERADKISWEGNLLGIQPRIRLTRSYDERDFDSEGYTLLVAGTVAGEEREFRVAISEDAQEQHRLRADDHVEGQGEAVDDPEMEAVDLRRVTDLRVMERGKPGGFRPPPWHQVPPAFSVYRHRGCRRLAVRTYESKCRTCIWGSNMAVEMIIDHWKPDRKKYRTETFCFGPLACPFYKAGPARRVPGRKGMVWVEEDWVDAQDVEHRGPDD